MAKEKPGVMIYWETFDAFEAMPDGQSKILITAIRQYAQYGVIPEFKGEQLLSIIWQIIKPRIDADNERYEKIREQRVNAINTRWRKKQEEISEDIQMHSDDTDEYESIRNIPTTTTTTSTTTSTDKGIREKGNKVLGYKVKGQTASSLPSENVEEKNLLSEQEFEALRQEKLAALQEYRLRGGLNGT